MNKKRSDHKRPLLSFIPIATKIATLVMLAFEPIIASPPLSLKGFELPMCAKLKWIDHDDKN
jgi:hypothetical protein